MVIHINDMVLGFGEHWDTGMCAWRSDPLCMGCDLPTCTSAMWQQLCNMAGITSKIWTRDEEFMAINDLLIKMFGLPGISK